MVVKIEEPLKDPETFKSMGNEIGSPEICSKKISRRGTVYQLIACLIANTSVVGPAMGLGYSAIALEPIGSEDSGIKVTDNEKSWIASITAIAIPIGCILSSITMRRGRRFAMMTTSATSILGWLTIYFSQNVTQILIGRSICGVAMGLASVPATVYAAEISAPKLRGIVVTWTSVSIAVGILIVYIFGFIFQENWRLVSLLCGLFPMTSIILVITKLPESPLWLRSKGREFEAEKKSRKFVGLKKIDQNNLISESQTQCLKEIEKVSIIGDNESPKDEIELETGRSSLLLKMENLKPLMIMVGYFFFQQFSGIFVVIYYAVDFTLEAGVQMDGHLAAILIGITRLSGTIMVSYISRKYGRRKPSILSGTGMTIFMGILSAYLWANSRGYKINDGGIIPVLSIIMYILTSTMGFLVLPFAMIGELYPAKYKDLFSGVTTCLAYVFSFIVLKIYPDMLKIFHKHGVFLFYSIISLIGTIFVLLFLPETKGRTLREIEESFSSKKNKNNNIQINHFQMNHQTIDNNDIENNQKKNYNNNHCHKYESTFNS